MNAHTESTQRPFLYSSFFLYLFIALFLLVGLYATSTAQRNETLDMQAHASAHALMEVELLGQTPRQVEAGNGQPHEVEALAGTGEGFSGIYRYNLPDALVEITFADGHVVQTHRVVRSSNPQTFARYADQVRARLGEPVEATANRYHWQQPGIDLVMTGTSDEYEVLVQN